MHFGNNHFKQTYSHTIIITVSFRMRYTHRFNIPTVGILNQWVGTLKGVEVHMGGYTPSTPLGALLLKRVRFALWATKATIAVA